MKNILLFTTLILLALLALVSYKKKELPLKPISCAPPVAVEKLSGSSPAITKDNEGNTVLSWVRSVTDSTSVLCYSIIKNGVKTGIVTIPSSKYIHPHAENLPRIIFKPSGEIIAVWGVKNPSPKNKYSGLINYAQSFDGGKTWTEAKRLVQDTAGNDQRYSDVALMKNGEVAIIWLDNRKTTSSEGSALFVAVTEGRNGFVKEKLISQPACQCCRTKVFADSRGYLHALYRGILNDSIRDMVHVVSKDGGKTFSSPERIHNDNWVLKGCPHTGPAMTENDEGLHYAWFTGGLKKGSFYIRSDYSGRFFSSYDSVSALGTHPQLSSMPGGQVVIVWDESVQTGGKYYKRIGMQVRNKKGIATANEFITADTSYSTYPVLLPVNDDQVIVAYTSKENNKEYVQFKNVKLNLN